MNLILTMAGKYSRFVNEGYRIPKYLLPWGNKSILSEVISELNKFNNFKNIFLIANKRDEIYMPHVRNILKYLNIPNENLYLIEDTSGQAETAYQGINKFKHLIGIEPIVFHNIDTILYARDFKNLNAILEENDAYIDIFKSSNHAYSYVLSENNRVQEIAEKIVISNQATSGLYAFKTVDTFLNYYSLDTLYISDIYKKMLDDNKNIVTSYAHDEKDTLVLGTPSEYLTNAYRLN